MIQRAVYLAGAAVLAAIIITSLWSLQSFAAAGGDVSVDARHALTWLYRIDASAKAIGQRARAVLVFPKIAKAKIVQPGATTGAAFGEATVSIDVTPVNDPPSFTGTSFLHTRQIGAFKVTMVRPALDSLQTIMDLLKRDEPQIYAALGTAGALCARHVRGAPNTVSSHAWGMAIDLTLTGKLDQMGDAATQFGLVVLAEYFNDAGWFWGAGYGREDSMHFEPGEVLLRQWAAEGSL